MLFSLAIIAIPLGFFISASVKSAPQSFSSNYEQIKQAMANSKIDVKSCVEVPFRTEVEEVIVISTKQDKNPRGIPRTIHHVAVLFKENGEKFYGHQILAEINGQCLVPYSSLGADAPPISWSFSEKEAEVYALAWYEWRLKNISNERVSIQRFLNSPTPKMPKEDFAAYSKLGFKMPKKWEEIK
jgi:hypothetical protein